MLPRRGTPGGLGIGVVILSAECSTAGFELVVSSGIWLSKASGACLMARPEVMERFDLVKGKIVCRPISSLCSTLDNVTEIIATVFAFSSPRHPVVPQSHVSQEWFSAASLPVGQP